MKVGNYVHWRYQNYLNCGLSVDRESGEKTDPQKIFREHREELLSNSKLQKTVNNAQVRELEQQINYFFDPTPGVLDFGYDEEQKRQIEAFLRRIVEQTIEKLKPNALKGNTWNPNNLATSKGGGSVTLEDGETETWASIRRGTNFSKANTTYYALDRRIKQILATRDNLDRLRKEGKSSSIDDAFIQRVNQLQTDYSKMIEEIQNTANTEKAEGKYIDKKTAGIRSQKVAVGKYTSEKGSFTKDLQSIIDMTLQITDTDLKGILGEVVPVVSQWAWQTFQGKTYKEVDQLLQTLNMEEVIDLTSEKAGWGQKKSIKISKSDSVIVNTNLDNWKEQVQVKIGPTTLNTMATQDKVDIKLDIDGGKTVNASVKNVNLNSGNNVSILKGANMVTYVQDYPIFANHFLNVAGNIGRSDRAPTIDLRAAHDAMKFTIALHALVGGLWAQNESGNVFKTEMAELFIINDSSSGGHFKIYTMESLIKAIQKNLDYIKLDFPMTFYNKWRGGQAHDMKAAFARVAGLLGDLRVQKLNASLDPAIFKDPSLLKT